MAENLEQGMQFYGRARSSGEISHRLQQCLIYSGLNYGAFNAAVLREPSLSQPKQLVSLIEEARDFYELRGVRWSYWFCTDALGPDAAREADAIFRHYRMHLLTVAPGLFADQLALPRPDAPVVDLLPVQDAATRTAFARIISVTFDIPLTVCTAIYESERAWREQCRGYVAYADGKAVSTAAVCDAGGVLGFYSVATLPNQRGKGYAEATMRQILLQHGPSRRSILQSTRAGLGLYEKMGYRPVTSFRVFIS